jgi:hypothetical protein
MQIFCIFVKKKMKSEKSISLIDNLKNQTDSLRIQYLEKTKDWADRYFDNMVEKRKWTESKWCKYFGLTPRIANQGHVSCEFLSFPNGFYNTKESKEYSNIKHEIEYLHRIGKNSYIEKELKQAELKYKNSIEKLAKRITDKNLNQDNLVITTARIGINLETTFTDGINVVKAWTIIQRPHYRYLVK